MLFFEETNIFDQWNMTKKLSELKSSNAKREANIKDLTEKVNEINTNPEALEKFARENCRMKKADEVVFLFVEEKDRPED